MSLDRHDAADARTIAKLKLLSPFISFGMNPDMLCAQKPDRRIR